jgi:adenosine kinase
MPGKFSDHILPDKIHILNVSFTMETFETEFGGTGGNIAYSLAKLGAPTVLAGAVGNDFGNYRKHLAKLNKLKCKIETHKDTATATGFVVTDKDDNQIWSFYRGAMKYSANIGLEKILKPGDILMIAPNDPQAMVKYAGTAAKMKIPYMFDPAFNIPHIAPDRLRTAIENCAILIGNDYEIELICRKLKTTKTKLAENGRMIITTLGARGSEIIHNGRIHKIPAAKPDKVLDPTGAGDAYRAGFLGGYIKGLSPEICGKMGAVTAVYTVERIGTQTHSFNRKGFERRYRKNFGKRAAYLLSDKPVR